VIDVALKDLQKIPFDELKMEKELGKGGFGTVYKCIYEGKSVAVKQLSLEGINSSARVARFQEFSMEAFFMSQLHHDNIVQLIGLCMNPFCLVTEFVPCGDLYHLLKEEEILFPWEFILRIALDIALGMR
jgi:serine/threonine protein kinase